MLTWNLCRAHEYFFHPPTKKVVNLLNVPACHFAALFPSACTIKYCKQPNKVNVFIFNLFLPKSKILNRCLLTNADITLPRAERDRLILVASLSLSPYQKKKSQQNKTKINKTTFAPDLQNLLRSQELQNAPYIHKLNTLY